MHTVVAAALVRDGRVLLGHRSPTRRWYPDVWDVLGGHVDDGESPPAALVRELAEEIGVTVGLDLGEPLVRIVDPDGQDGLLDITIWVVTSWHGEIANREPDEHDEVRWFARADLTDLPLAHPRLPELLDAVLTDASPDPDPAVRGLRSATVTRGWVAREFVWDEYPGLRVGKLVSGQGELGRHPRGETHAVAGDHATATLCGLARAEHPYDFDAAVRLDDAEPCAVCVEALAR